MYNVQRMRGKFSWKTYCLAAALLLTVALFLLARVYPNFPGDERALVEFQDLRTGWLDAAALAISSLGWRPVAGGLVLGVTLLLVVLRRRADAFIVVFSLVPMLVGDGLKRLVERPRPDYLLMGQEPGGLSFPSGHSVFAFLFGGLLIYLSGELVTSPALRRWLQTVLAVLILAMGASRVYLGVHWPSDVIGGYLYGGMALLGLIALRKLIADRWRSGCRHRFLPW